MSTKTGSVRMTLRRAGRVIGTARRSVLAGRRFTLTIRARHSVRGGRYTLTTILRPIDGRTWAGSERVLIR